MIDQTNDMAKQKSKTVYLESIAGMDPIKYPGTDVLEFPAGPYRVVKESERQYTISNGLRELTLNKWRFTFEAPAKVEYLQTCTGDDVEAVITKHRDGFAIRCKDLETGTWFPTIRIWKTFPLAIDAAKILISS